MDLETLPNRVPTERALPHAAETVAAPADVGAWLEGCRNVAWADVHRDQFDAYGGSGSASPTSGWSPSRATART
jgi:hypothetical protein